MKQTGKRESQEEEWEGEGKGEGEKNLGEVFPDSGVCQ